MSDNTRTQAEQEAGTALLDAYIKRRQAEEDAKGPNPLQTPQPRYGQNPVKPAETKAK